MPAWTLQASGTVCMFVYYNFDKLKKLLEKITDNIFK